MPKAIDLAKLEKQAIDYAHEWLRTNPVLPPGVEADDKQFTQLMDTVRRGLAQAFASGYMGRK